MTMIGYDNRTRTTFYTKVNYWMIWTIRHALKVRSHWVTATATASSSFRRYFSHWGCSNGNGKMNGFYSIQWVCSHGDWRQQQRQRQPINMYYKVYFSVAVAITKWVYNPFHDDTILLPLPLPLPSVTMWTHSLDTVESIHFDTKWSFPLPLPSLSVNEP